MSALTPLPAITDVIPHRGTMLLLDHIVGVDDCSCSSTYTPQADRWYADANGNMPTWIGIELMAQTVAAYVGISKSKAGLPPKQGVLLGSRSYQTSRPAFTEGEPLHINAIMNFLDEGGLGAFDCTITDTHGAIIASATLKVFEPDDFQAFLKGSPE